MTTRDLEQRARDASANARTAFTDIHYLENQRATPFEGAGGPIPVVPVSRVNALAEVVLELSAIVVELTKSRRAS